MSFDHQKDDTEGAGKSLAIAVACCVIFWIIVISAIIFLTRTPT